MSASDDLRVSDELAIRASELQESATRSSGPGGQHVNKTSTRVVLRWSVARSSSLTESQRSRIQSKLGRRLTRDGDLIVTCDRTRSRARNREHARQRIAEIVSEALARRAVRRATEPSRAARARRLDSKSRRSAVKRTRRPPKADSD